MIPHFVNVKVYIVSVAFHFNMSSMQALTPYTYYGISGIWSSCGWTYTTFRRIWNDTHFITLIDFESNFELNLTLVVCPVRLLYSIYGSQSLVIFSDRFSEHLSYDAYFEQQWCRVFDGSPRTTVALLLYNKYNVFNYYIDIKQSKRIERKSRSRSLSSHNEYSDYLW